MVRNAMFGRVQLAARDAFRTLAELEDGGLSAGDWEAALGAYWDEHEIDGHGSDRPLAGAPDRRPCARASGPCARSSTTPRVTATGRSSPIVDLDASDAAGEPVIRTQSFGT